MKKSLKSKLFWRGILDKFSDFSSPQIQAPSPVFSIALLFICLAANLHVRCFPAYFPLLKQFATINVIERRAEQLEKQSQGNANATLSEESGAMAAKAPEVLKKSFREDLEQEYAKLKDPYQDEKGRTYLMEFDPYAWARWTENTIRHGFPGDEKIHGTSYDRLMAAPFGAAMSFQQFFCQLSAFFFRIMDILPFFSLESFLFYIPVLYSLFFLTILFFFVRRWSNDIAAALAVLFVGLVPKVLVRSSAGWLDTDSLNAILALVIGWCMIEGALEKRNLKVVVAFSMLAGLFQGIFALTWGGWWFMWAVAFAFHVLLSLPDLRDRDAVHRRIRQAVIALTTYIFATFVFVYALAGVNLFGVLDDFLKNVLWLRLGNTGLDTGNIWPDTYRTVSELAPSRFREIVQGFFGSSIFALSVAGFGAMVVAGWRGRARPFVILLLCWSLFMLVASFKGNRFTFFLAIPFFILSAMFWGDWLPHKLSEIRSSLRRLLGAVVFLACIIFMVSGVLRRGIAQGEHIFPIMNDSWHKALSWLAGRTPQNSIVNAWWDYGYWIKYYGKRRVIFDNGTQTGQLTYWMARVLTSSDENEALSILRMLDNASDRTFGKLLSHFHDPFRAKAVLEHLLKMDAADAAKALKGWKVPDAIATEVLSGLYRKPAPAYLMVDGTMWGKFPSISSLSSWNVSKLLVLRERKKTPIEIRKELESIFDLSPKASEEIRQDVLGTNETPKNPEEQLSTSAVFYTSKMTGQREGKLIHFDGGLVFDAVSKDALLYSTRLAKFMVPKKVLWFENDKKTEFLKTHGNDSRVAIVMKRGDEYRAVLADPKLEDSLFVRLMLENNVGLNHFKSVYSDPEHEVYIYKIIWSTEPKTFLENPA